MNRVNHFTETSKKVPFRYKGLTKRVVCSAVVECAIILTTIIMGMWIYRGGVKNNNLTECQEAPWTVYFAVMVFVIALFAIMYTFGMRKLKPVFRSSDVFFGEQYTRRIPPHEVSTSTAPELLQYHGNLADTAVQLQQLISDVKADKRELMAATKFLISDGGVAFLRDIKKGIDTFRLLDERLVRLDGFYGRLFSEVQALCAMVSLAGAYSEVEKCAWTSLFFKFLEFESVTFLAVIAIATFAGLKEYSQLLYISTKRKPVTDEEKFLISILAANCHGIFCGFARTENSGYAVIDKEGEADVFQPVHMSLFTYRKAKTAQSSGARRCYDEDASDCEGNYEMVGTCRSRTSQYVESV